MRYSYIVMFGVCFSIMSCSSEKKATPKVEVQLASQQTVQQELPIVTIGTHLEKLATFSRVATGVQFYYPGQGAYETNWDEFVTYGAYKVAATNSEQEFVDAMNELFKDVAPDVKFNDVNYQPPVYQNEQQVIVWRQNGYKDRLNTEGSIYYPERKVLDYSSVMNNVSYTDKTHYHMDYGNLIVDMPLILPVDGEQSDPLGKKFTVPTEWKVPLSFENQYVCIASFSKVWNVINNYWPYFNAIDIDWSQELNPLLSACAETDRRLSMKALRASLTKLEDNHINAWGDTDAFEGQYTVPVGFQWVEGKVIVVAKGETAPEEISIGDELISIDGDAALSTIEELAPYTYKSKAKRNDRALLLYALRRDLLSTVNLSLETNEGERYHVDLVASTNLYDTYDLADQAYVPPQSVQRKILENNIYYVDLSMSEESDVGETITALRDASAVVFDFRNYPNSWFGWFDMLAHFSQSPISSAPMYYHWTGSPNRDYVYQQRKVQTIEPKSPYIDIPVIVLASRYSQSSNEHALAFVQNAGLTIMGEPTSGINGNITFLYTAGVSAIFTGLEVRQNDESTHIGVGIVPDIFVEQTRESFIKGEDHQLNEAIKYLKQQLELINTNS